MIITAFLDFIFNSVIVLFTLFPSAKIADIPLIGGFVSSTLIYVVSLFKSSLVLFPFGIVVWQCFLWVLLFEGLMLGLKFLLGHHLPANMN